ncbi:hypothetical protein LUZ60_009227 [Juncus effusus]|nr:hypothetical protein LUZ60_009227 [Juncus effusus]
MEKSGPPWDWVAEFTTRSLVEGYTAAEWAENLSSAAAAPWGSPEMTELLACEICGNGHVGLAWKYAERALACGLASPMLFFSLLSVRIIPNRVLRPSSYRLYLELLLRHGFSFSSEIKAPNFKRIMVLIDDNLNLSKIFGFQTCENGIFVMLYIICIIWQLVDASLDDEGLLELIITNDQKPFWPIRPHDYEILQGDYKTERNEKLQQINTSIAIEMIGNFVSHKVISRLLALAHQNMPSQIEALINRLNILSTNSLSLTNSPKSSEAIKNFIQSNILREFKPKKFQKFHKNLISPNSSGSTSWIPIDLYLEDCIDGSVASTNSIEILSSLVKALQAINRSTWRDAFLALWIASLRLVQREREPVEGPVPRLDTRLSMLLSIAPLSIFNIIQENQENSSTNNSINNEMINMRNDLVSSLKSLGDFESLLVPPPLVLLNANQAALKAMSFVSGRNVMNGGNLHELGMNCDGNMRHLIVESCISRGLLDTSAYFWPGYIKNNNNLNQIQSSVSNNNQMLSWHSFMRGTPLNESMVSVLVSTPASSLAELKKIYEVAINGSEEEKVCAATVLCGATLISGWNIQEHTVKFVIKLLSPPVPVNYTGTESHLINHGAMLNAILTGISSVDCVKVFSFHGMVPELAASLMAICETFGSLFPTISLKTQQISPHNVFSNAFILLMRLWKFNHPPLEYCVMGEAAPVGSQLTPEFLLLLRNNNKTNKNVNNDGNYDCFNEGHVFVDSFPKLKLWYRQHQACLASTLNGIVNESSVRKNVDDILNMMFCTKVNKGSSLSSGSLSCSNNASDDLSNVNNLMSWPKLSAWDIMEAVPFVADSALTACSHGRLSPRELATGLKDLADYLPASLASIISYFSAEVTRGVWKPASMNGTDWPSPAANLSMVEEQIKKIVGATGVHVPSLVAGTNSQATLPLPLAAFVSLTITYKLDKASQLFLNLAGPALENLAVSCPWPSMPIVAALWTQKVRRWSDFLIFSASRTVFHHNHDAVVQLLRSCFMAQLGFPGSSDGVGGVGSLLGHGFGSHFSGGLSPVAPGILYLRSFRCIKNCVVLAEEILSLLTLSVQEISQTLIPKTKHKTLSNQPSLHSSMSKVKDAAALGATIVWLSGGSGLVQTLIQEMLPSWFLSVQNLHQGGERGRDRVVYHLGGHALAYFAVYSGMFAWGIDNTPLSKRRERVLRSHFEFLGRALEGRIGIACDLGLWRAYVLGFLGLVVECAPFWVRDVGSDGLKRVVNGLRRWGEEELAVDLLRRGGNEAMGLACELILASR